MNIVRDEGGCINPWEIHFIFFIEWMWVTGEPLEFVFLYIPVLSILSATLFTAFIATVKGWSVEKDL